MAEMFNILGFHANNDYEGNDNDNIRDVNEDFDRLYDRTNTRYQYDDETPCEKRLFADIDELMDQLSAEDLKILIKSEEELSQVQIFTRIFPNQDHNQ